MGYMTVAMILNDASDQVKEHPKQVADNLYRGMVGYDMRGERSVSYPIGNYANPMTVFSAQHADTPQLVLAYQNSLARFGYLSDLTRENQLEYRKQLLSIAKEILKEEEAIIRKLDKENDRN